MSNRLGLTVGVAILAASAWLAPAQAAGVKVGVLTCNVDSGWGYILGSSKDIRCNYVPNRGFGEHYSGSISKGRTEGHPWKVGVGFEGRTYRRGRDRSPRARDE